MHNFAADPCTVVLFTKLSVVRSYLSNSILRRERERERDLRLCAFFVFWGSPLEHGARCDGRKLYSKPGVGLVTPWLLFSVLSAVCRTLSSNRFCFSKSDTSFDNLDLLANGFLIDKSIWNLNRCTF